MATFEFANEWRPTNSIDIPEMGNFYLEAVNDDEGYYYYLMVKSALGTCSFMWYGPVIPDVGLLPNNYQVGYQRFQYAEQKVHMWITKWLNDKSKGITSAHLIEESKMFDEYRDIKRYMENYSDEVY